jgi:hypothetical protein
MLRIWLAVAALVLSATASQAKLEIQNIKAVHGLFGPERKSLKFFPSDQLCFRFILSGIKLDADGKIDASTTVNLVDADGKALLDRKSRLQHILPLGGESMLANVTVDVGDSVPVGDYRLTVTVKDNLADQTVSFSRKLTCRPTELAIVAPRLFYDADGKAPAPSGGLVGQELHLRLNAIGFGTARNSRIDTEMKVEVLDAEGKPTMPKPFGAAVKLDDTEKIKQTKSLVFRASFGLNRPGAFTLRITIADKVGKRSTQFEVPLKVTAP